MFRCDLGYGMDGINFGEIGLWKEECGLGCGLIVVLALVLVAL